MEILTTAARKPTPLLLKRQAQVSLWISIRMSAFPTRRQSQRILPIAPIHPPQAMTLTSPIFALTPKARFPAKRQRQSVSARALSRGWRAACYAWVLGIQKLDMVLFESFKMCLHRSCNLVRLFHD